MSWPEQKTDWESPDAAGNELSGHASFDLVKTVLMLLVWSFLGSLGYFMFKGVQFIWDYAGTYLTNLFGG